MRAVHLGLAAFALAVLTAVLWCWIDRPASTALAAAGSSGSLDPLAGAASIEGRSASDAANATSGPARIALGSAAEPEPEAAAPAWKPGQPPRLSGRVVLRDGAGVPGATVLAASGQFWIQVPLDVEPEGIPKGWFEVERTTTDAEGRFAFETLEPGTLRIVARAPGFAPAREDHLELPDRAEHALADIVLEPGVVLSGRVVDRERKGVEGATLLQPLDCGRDQGGNEVSFPSRGVPLATTGADGAFTIDELPPGPWSLVVDAPGFAVTEESGRTRNAGDRSEGLVFRVEAGFELLGRVRAEEGTLPERLRVSARPSPDEEEQPDPEGEEREVPSAVSERARSAICAADGTFTVRGLQGSTRYALSLWRTSEETGEWKLARGTAIVHGYSGQRGVEIVYKPEAVLLFAVKDQASGLPIPTLTVWAGLGNERVLRDDEGETRREFPDGRVRYAGLRPKPGGKPVHLRVAATGYADHERKDIVLAPGQTLDLGEIALAPERLVVARVVADATGEPVEGARVVLGTQSGEELRQQLASQPESDLFDHATLRYGRTDARGRASLSILPGKSTTAVADAVGYLASAPVTAYLAPGEDREIELRLRRGGTVVVRVRDRAGRPVQGIAVEKKDPAQQEQNVYFDGEDRSDRTDEEGIVRFEALEPGVYAFRAADRDRAREAWFGNDPDEAGEGWVETLAAEGATATVDFTVESRGGLLGTVREGGTALAGARLRLVDPAKVGEEQPGFWGGERDPLAAMTDAQGTYRFEKVRGGAYVLEIDHGTRKMAARFPVSIDDPPRVFDVDLDVAVIEGRIVGEDGRALEGIEVQCLNAEGRSESEGSWRVLLTEDEEGDADVDYRQDVPSAERTDANGRYALRGVRSGDPVQVVASGDRVQPETKPAMTLGPEEIRRNVDFVLKDAGAIEVAMAGSPSSSRGGWYQVRAYRIVEEGEAGETAYGHVGNWNRVCRLGSLVPGRYRVQVLRGGRGQGQPLLDVEVDVVVRETSRVDFQAP